jgi:hypothetical protein
MPSQDLVTARVEFSGPFFQKDPRLTFRQNIRKLMDLVAEWGEGEVRGQMQGIGTGRTARAYTGRTHALSGKRWAVTAVVSPLTQGLSGSEAQSIMAAAHEIEYGHSPGRGRYDPLGRGKGHHIISRLARTLRRMKDHLQDEMLKGLT